MAIGPWQSGQFGVRPNKKRGLTKLNPRVLYDRKEYGVGGPSRGATRAKRNQGTYALADQASLGVVPKEPANWAEIDAASMGVVAPNPQNISSNRESYDASLVTHDPTLKAFGTEKSDQAYLNYLAYLNQNQLNRRRSKEDNRYNRRSADIAIERARRGIPDRYNQRGMRNSGLFDRGMGEFESDSLRTLGNLERQFGRTMQDYALNDARYGQQYYASIGDDAKVEALKAAAATAALNPNVLSGGDDVSRAAARNTINKGL